MFGPAKPSQNNLWAYFLVLSLLYIMGRVSAIDAPLLEVQVGRQVDTAMMARNFYRHGYRIGYPELDTAGTEPGYLESNFPIYPFTVALLYQLTGVWEVWGRILSIAFGLVGLWYLYLLADLFLPHHVALFLCLLYPAGTVGRLYQQTFQPDSLLAMLTAIAFYHGYLWLSQGRERNWLPAALSFCLAALIKIPALYLLLPYSYWLFLRWNERWPISWGRVFTAALIVILPVKAWYRHAQEIGEQYLSWGIFKHLNYGEIFIFWNKPDWYQDWLGSLLFRCVPLPLGLLGLVGIVALVRKSELRSIGLWIAGILSFYFVSAQSLYRHEYYHLPSVIPWLLATGAGIVIIEGWLKQHNVYKYYHPSLTVLIIIAITFNGAILVFNWKPEAKDLPVGEAQLWHQWNERLWQVGLTIDKQLPEESILLAPSNIPIYYGDRRGWVLLPWEMETGKVESYATKGATHLLIAPLNTNVWQRPYTYPGTLDGWLARNTKLVFSERSVDVYSINRQP